MGIIWPLFDTHFGPQRAPKLVCIDGISQIRNVIMFYMGYIVYVRFYSF